jgi:RNA polymerase sigma-70 factor (ECF subfamily)
VSSSTKSRDSSAELDAPKSAVDSDAIKNFAPEQHIEGECAANGEATQPIADFDTIAQHQLGFIWRTLASLGVPESELDDQCQEVLLIVHRRLQDFDGASLRGWLYGISQRVAAAYRRRAVVRKEVAVAEPMAREDVSRDVLTIESRRFERELLAVLAELDGDKQQVFLMYEIEEMTLQEIAATLVVPLQTIYSRLRAARKHVRQAFSRPERTRTE